MSVAHRDIYPRPSGRPKLDHRENAINHVQRRCWERLGLALARRDVEELSAKCASGSFGAPGRIDREKRQHFAAVLRGHDVRLIYCPALGVVVTLYQRPLGTKKGDPQ